MPTSIQRLISFDGPNLYGPQPGVFLEVRSDKDRSRRIKSALKDAGQSVGLVIGYLDVSSEPAGGEYLIGAGFTTPTPALGVELARYVVAGLNAREAGDEEWDAEGLLWELNKRSRAEALPVAALQVMAEAAGRGIPALVRADGQVQLGYGARAWSFDPAPLRSPTAADPLAPNDIGFGAPPSAEPAITVPWEQLGPIPIVALAGGKERDPAARLIAATLYTQQPATAFAAKAGFEETQALLADPNATIAVIGLATAGIATRGLAFERCAFSAVTGMPNRLPPDVQDRAELARVLGVPMLVTDPQGWVALNADVPDIVALAEYAPCSVVYISTLAENTTVGFHRAAGGAALFVREGAVIAAEGAAERPVAAATLAPEDLPGALAALALLWKMGLTWEQIIPTFGGSYDA